MWELQPPEGEALDFFSSPLPLTPEISQSTNSKDKTENDVSVSQDKDPEADLKQGDPWKNRNLNPPSPMTEQTPLFARFPQGSMAKTKEILGKIISQTPHLIQIPLLLVKTSKNKEIHRKIYTLNLSLSPPPDRTIIAICVILTGRNSPKNGDPCQNSQPKCTPCPDTSPPGVNAPKQGGP